MSISSSVAACRRPQRLSRSRLAMLAVALFAPTLWVLPTPAHAATPADPVVIFAEDFQNAGTAPNLLLDAYAGAAGTTYSADPVWLARTRCNGLIVSELSAQVAAGECGAFTQLQKYARALGQVAGFADPNTNAAVAAYTEGGDPGSGFKQFITTTPITVPTPNRFVTFSVDSVASSCGVNDPQLQFYVGTTPIGTTPLNPCTGTAILPDVTGGRFTSNGSFLVSGTSLSVSMVNLEGSGRGNDAAFDNIRVLDVTPSMTKSFNPGTIGVNQIADLTFTITNTSERSAKSGWSFRDDLSSPLTRADTYLSHTCQTAPTVTGGAGSPAITVTGDLREGETECTVTVHVISTSTGAIINGPLNITALVGVLPPTLDNTLTVNNAPQLSLVKSSPASVLPNVGGTVTFNYQVTNTGGVTLTGIVINEVSFDGSGPKPTVTCPKTTLEPADVSIGRAAESMTCTASYVVTQADLDIGRIRNTATATGTPPPNRPSDPTPPAITSPESTVAVPGDATPRLTVTKTATPTRVTKPGQLVTYSFAVTNTGGVTLKNVVVTDDKFSGTGKLSAINCPSTTLVPGATMTCTATYVVTQADVEAGSITNSATAAGTPPTSYGSRFSSPRGQATITASQNPRLTLVKTADQTKVSRVGEKVTYRFKLTNTGNVKVNKPAINEAEFSGTGQLSPIRCPKASLAPGEAETCTATYEVTADDLAAGKLTNKAAALGSRADGTALPPSSLGVSTVTIEATAADDPLPLTGADPVGPIAVASALALLGLLALGFARRRRIG